MTSIMKSVVRWFESIRANSWWNQKLQVGLLETSKLYSTVDVPSTLCIPSVSVCVCSAFFVQGSHKFGVKIVKVCKVNRTQRKTFKIAYETLRFLRNLNVRAHFFSHSIFFFFFLAHISTYGAPHSSTFNPSKVIWLVWWTQRNFLFVVFFFHEHCAMKTCIPWVQLRSRVH